jgi:hypothetical protein
MSMSHSLIDKLFECGLGDYSLSAIRWSENGEDILADIVAPPGTCTTVLTLRFVWAHNVDIRFAFGDYFGQPLIYGVTRQKREHPAVGWNVEFSFGGQPNGHLRLSCNAIEPIPYTRPGMSNGEDETEKRS